MKIHPKLTKAWDKTKEVVSKIGKRNIIIISSVLFIGLAIYLNYLFFTNPLDDIGYGKNNMEDEYGDVGKNNGDNQNVGGNEEDYFAATVLSRQRARDEALEVLQAVVASDDALEVTKEQALEDISRIALDIEKEANIESLIRSKGIEQCVAVINGTTASIVVKAEELLPNKLAQIYEIVYEQTGIIPANVNVIEKAG
ncbi:MAG: SpoIIIAH-like family protein [Clostridiales bacterium]|nr:SpoIIIAH-like family protein [Clostridiales bacterium]